MCAAPIHRAFQQPCYSDVSYGGVNRADLVALLEKQVESFPAVDRKPLISKFLKEYDKYFFLNPVKFDIAQPQLVLKTPDKNKVYQKIFEDFQKKIKMGRGITVQMLLTEPDRIIIARPLKELWSHVRNYKLPSLRLIVRAIQVLVLGIFRGHLCDYVVFENKGSLYHSLKGRVEKTNRESMQKAYPYMLENAFEKVVKKTAQEDIVIGDHYKEIDPQMIRDYYHRFCQFDITPKEKGNTLVDLFNSKILC